MAPTLTRDSIINRWFTTGPGRAAALSAAGAAPPPPAAAGDGKAPPKPPTPPAADKAPPAPTDNSDKPGDTDEVQVDATVTEGLKAVVSAIDNALKKQQADPGNSSDTIDAKVLAGLEQLKSIAAGVLKDQTADNDANAKPGMAGPAQPEGAPAPEPQPKDGGAAPGAGLGGAPPPPAATAADGAESLAAPPTSSVTPGNAVGTPGDSDDSGPGPGEIEADLICQNPDCGHAAGVHEDNEDGGNSGACTTPGCDCPGMVPLGVQVNAPGTSNDGTPQGGGTSETKHGEDQGVTAASTVELLDIGAPDGPGQPPAAPEAAEGDQAPEMEPPPAPELPPLDPMPQAAMGPAFTIPVGLIEGKPTGDGRMVANGATSWRTPPLPLMWLSTSPHDPSGMSGNDPAFLAGRIDTIERQGDNIVANGFFLATKEGMKAAEELEQMGRFGVSADIGSAEVQITADPTPVIGGGEAFDAELLELLTKGELMGFTGCPFAAFAGCYIVLGDGTNAPEAELPEAPAESKMAINFVNEVPCEPCGEGLNPVQPIVASGAPAAGPIAPPKDWFDDPQFTAGDERLRETIDSKTGKPSGKFACPMTVTADGRVFGHIAQWGVCHQSPKFMSRGQCVLAPRSKTGYAWFHGRGSVLTAEGEVIDVGRLSADAGHASESDSLTAAQAISYYDNSALTAAVVRAGEDEFGIWVAGSVHPSASPEQVFTLRANPPSGDWRPVGSGQELVAVLAVNEPGFPVAKATMSPQTGHIKSLVAAGVPLFEMPATERPQTFEERFAAMERGLAPVFASAKDGLRHHMDEVRSS